MTTPSKANTPSTTLLGRKEKSLTLIPYGGIASRLRTIASVVEIMKDSPKEVSIIWFRTEKFHSSFNRLFTFDPKIISPNISIREDHWSDWLFNDTPRKTNLYIPLLAMLFHYDRLITPEKTRHLIQHNPQSLYDLMKNTEEKTFLSTNLNLLESNRNIYKLFEPTVEVANVRNYRMSGWGNNVVGIHINRKNGDTSMQDAPTELFIRKMQQMIEQDKTTTFFVATTSRNERECLQTLFKSRVFAPYSISDSTTEEGIIESFGELLALSNTRKILSTPDSTFAQVASEIGKIPLEQLSLYNF